MSVDNFETVSFRVRKSDYAEFERVAQVLYQAKNPKNNMPTIKQPKVSILAKTFLYVMTNQFQELEAQAKAVLEQAQAQGLTPAQAFTQLGGR